MPEDEDEEPDEAEEAEAAALVVAEEALELALPELLDELEELLSEEAPPQLMLPLFELLLEAVEEEAAADAVLELLEATAAAPPLTPDDEPLPATAASISSAVASSTSRFCVKMHPSVSF